MKNSKFKFSLFLLLVFSFFVSSCQDKEDVTPVTTNVPNTLDEVKLDLIDIETGETLTDSESCKMSKRIGNSIVIALKIEYNEVDMLDNIAVSRNGADGDSLIYSVSTFDEESYSSDLIQEEITSNPFIVENQEGTSSIVLFLEAKLRDINSYEITLTDKNEQTSTHSFTLDLAECFIYLYRICIQNHDLIDSSGVDLDLFETTASLNHVDPIPGNSPLIEFRDAGDGPDDQWLHSLQAENGSTFLSATDPDYRIRRDLLLESAQNAEELGEYVTINLENYFDYDYFVRTAEDKYYWVSCRGYAISGDLEQDGDGWLFYIASLN